jgi:hypothetical protein
MTNRLNTDESMSKKQPLVLGYLDVLGWECLFKKHGLKEMERKYDNLIQHVREAEKNNIVLRNIGGHNALGVMDLNIAYFSDTICFWIPYNDFFLLPFTQVISESICYGLEAGLPMRGAIVVGDMILDRNNSKYIGQPIIEAARTEKLQKWIGVSFGESFKNPRFNKLDPRTIIVYANQYKDKTDPLALGLVVDWPRTWRESRKGDVCQLVSSMNTSSDPAISCYYSNTLEFIEFSKRFHDWFLKPEQLQEMEKLQFPKVDREKNQPKT